MSNLTASQHERLRNLVRRSPVFIGKRIEVHDDRVEIVEPDDLVIGLGPVVDAVDGAPTDQWPGLVDECLERILGALTGGTPELRQPTEQLLTRVLAKLRPADSSPTEWWTYAPEIAPNLLVVLALDFDDRIAILNDDDVRRHGFDQLLDAGISNLCHQLPEQCGTHEDIFIIAGQEYTASTVMVLPWIIESVTGVTDLPYGVLVAVPNDNVLVFHVIRNAAGTRYALSEIARLAVENFEDSPRALSSSVYWWPTGSGQLVPVAHHAGDGVLGQDIVTPYPPEFVDVLAELDFH